MHDKTNKTTYTPSDGLCQSERSLIADFYHPHKLAGILSHVMAYFMMVSLSPYNLCILISLLCFHVYYCS